VSVSLPERNLLEGGEPGSGKSTIVQLLIAAAALDPSVRLTLLDPKLVELAVWQRCGRLVGPNVEQAIEVLKQLIAELDDRYLTLLANRARKVTEGDGLPLHLLVVVVVVVEEELAFYTNGPDRKAAQAFSVLLRDFVARGRAAGMVTIATTQKPSADVVADLPAGPVRLPLGAQVLDPGRLRHDPGAWLGRPGLLGGQH
jgi:DNA segregation ATPase FtsK/SpoIIIE, S-DNA-T family